MALNHQRYLGVSLLATILFANTHCLADIKIWLLEKESVELLTFEMEWKYGKAIPDELVVKPDVYTYKNKLFYAEKGLLRICDIPNENHQRLVWNGDLFSFLSGLTWIHAHGRRDEDLNDWLSEEIAKKDKLIKICGGISLFTKSLLESLGIPSRLVCFLTLEEWNSYDNGHTCLEIFWEGRWQLVDIDQKIVVKSNEQVICAKDLPATIQSGNYRFERLSNAPVYCNQSDATSYNYNLLAESVFSSNEARKNWYQRISGVVLINDSGYWWFHHTEKNRIQSYSPQFRYLEKDEFENRFYK